MASTSKDSVPSTSDVHENVGSELEPGACPESVLNPTDSFEEFASEMSSSLQERNTSLTAKGSTISEIQSEIGEASKEAQLKAAKSSDDLQSNNVSVLFCLVYLIMFVRIRAVERLSKDLESAKGKWA